MARPKKIDEGTGKPISIRLSEQYQSQLETAAKRLDLPISEVMRLCLRIGMEHFTRIDYDTAKCIVDAVDKAKDLPTKTIEGGQCADTAHSENITPTSQPTKQTVANIVQLPPPPVLATLMHESLAAETTKTPPVKEQRQEVIYPKKIPRKSS